MIIELAHADLREDVKLRSRIEPERGLYMAESATVIERAIAAGHRPRSFLVSARWLPTLRPLIAAATGSVEGGEVPVFVAPEEVLERMTGFHLHRGALAAMQRPELPSVMQLLTSAQPPQPTRRVVVLENLVDHTNVGAAFRSAAALGIDAVLVTPSCHDPLYRRAARVSMGTVFQVPWTRIGTQRQWAAEGVPLLHAAGFKVAALALEDRSLALGDPRLAECESLAMVLGTEGAGLFPSTIAACDYTVKIPMAHGVDSLNVAAARAVAFWELRAR